MLLASVAIILGLPLLLWSADKFVGGAASVARQFGLSPLLIGMLIIGFGTSAPEIIVSVIAALEGSSGIALGNAFGSNIANIALILGITALISPIAVRSEIIRKELPILLGLTFFAAWQLLDANLSKDDAFSLLGLFILLISWSIWTGLRGDKDALAEEFGEELNSVEIATFFGVSDVVIGLTVIAIGTSLPELASSLVAVKKGEHDMALGNVIGSNMFNTLAVVGIAGVIHPMQVDSSFLYRDTLFMLILSVALFVFCIGLKGPGRLNRLEGGVFLLAYIGYTYYLVTSAFIA